MQFQEIPIGGHFEFLGRRYLKLAMSMARDEDHYGNIFQAQTEVLPDPLAHPRCQLRRSHQLLRAERTWSIRRCQPTKTVPENDGQEDEVARY
jgi:hypothetical protein